MSLSYGDTRYSLENRSNFLGNLGIDYRDLVCAKQIHASNVRCILEEDKGSGAFEYDNSIDVTDAFITAERNIPFAILTADCLSIFLFDPLTPAAGLVHAGWRSSKENITLKTIKLMQKQFNTKPSSLHVGFGPAIRSCCCEVAGDFQDFFPDEVFEKDGRFYLDLAKVNKMQLLDSGVKETNISDSRICTVCKNNEYFSFRKEGKSCGRLMSVVMLK
jgi:polyphenol oxidase